MTRWLAFCVTVIAGCVAYRTWRPTGTKVFVENCQITASDGPAIRVEAAS